MADLMKSTRERNRAGWMLLAGFVLACLGLVAESQVSTGNLPPGRSASYLPGYATADSNGTMIAVTGIDITGGSILYLIDTEAKQLAAYQATGGSASTMGVKFVGGRNIALDLQVDGYNDKSEYSYKELAERFARRRPDSGGD
jgi:hypothetical protein